MTSLYQQQNSATDTPWKSLVANTCPCDIDSKQKRLASKRMEGKGSIYSPSPWPLFDYNGQNYSLRVW